MIQVNAISQDQPAQAGRSLLTVQNTGGHAEGQGFPVVTVGGGRVSIELQEDEAGTEGRALVSIDKGMVVAKIEEVGGCYIDRIAIGGSASETRLRGRYRRFEHGAVTKSARSTELGDGFGVDLLDDLHRQMEAVVGIGVHARRFMVRAYRFPGVFISTQLCNTYKPAMACMGKF